MSMAISDLVELLGSATVLRARVAWGDTGRGNVPPNGVIVAEVKLIGPADDMGQPVG